MKRNTFRFAAILSLALMLTASVVFANPDLKIKATIPFEFSVGSRTLPAGKYILKPVNNEGLLVIQNVDNQRLVALLSTSNIQAIPGQEQSRLVFRKYGDQYFLGQVWPGGIAAGFQSGKSDRERELLKAPNKNLARRSTSPENVTVTAQ
ncbi:MAG: hypothetical protein U0Z53_23475 [Blastocatellia bacterium]